jgi:hypothetical protein
MRWIAFVVTWAILAGSVLVGAERSSLAWAPWEEDPQQEDGQSDESEQPEEAGEEGTSEEPSEETAADEASEEAAEPTPEPDDGATKSEPEEAEPRKPAARLAAIRRKLKAGDVDAAMAPAKSLYEQAPNPQVKTDALELLAEALRKKGRYRLAIGAYNKLRAEYEEGSEEYIRCNAVVEVLKASREGVYHPMLQGSKVAAGGDAKPRLSDDETLDKAIKHFAETRAEEILGQSRSLSRTRSPQDVVSAFVELRESIQNLVPLSKDLAVGTELELARRAGERLETIASTVLQRMRAQAEKYADRRFKPWAYSNVDKRNIRNANALLRRLAGQEAQFQSLLSKGLAGKHEDIKGLRAASELRANEYSSLAEDFVVLPYEVEVF